MYILVYFQRNFYIIVQPSKIRISEALSNCKGIQIDKTIRELKTEGYDASIIIIAAAGLIAKEYVYHQTCYRGYIR